MEWEPTTAPQIEAESAPAPETVQGPGVPGPVAEAAAAVAPLTLEAPKLPSSLTVAGLRARIDKQLTSEDGFLEELLLAAFTQAQAPQPLGCGRLLVAPTGPTTRTYRLRWRRVVVADCREIQAVTVAGENVSEYHVTEYDEYVVALEFGDAIVRAGYSMNWGWGEVGTPMGYRQGDRPVTVTARFGFQAIPPNLNEAIYQLAARMYYEKEAQFADQVAVGEGGVTQVYYRQLPPRTRLAFETFAIPQGVGGLA